MRDVAAALVLEEAMGRRSRSIETIGRHHLPQIGDGLRRSIQIWSEWPPGLKVECLGGTPLVHPELASSSARASARLQAGM